MGTRHRIDLDLEARPSDRRELQHRLSAVSPIAAQPQLSTAEPTKKTKRGLGLPGWALIGALTMFTIAAWIKIHTVTYPKLTARQAAAIVGPSLTVSPLDEAAQENNASLRKALRLLHPHLEWLRENSSQGIQLTQRRAEHMSAITQSKAFEEAIGILIRPGFRADVLPLGESSDSATALELFAGIVQNPPANANTRMVAEEAYRLLYLYPTLENTLDQGDLELVQSSARIANDLAGSLGSNSNYTTERLQDFLNQMKPPSRFFAEATRAKQALSEFLVAELLDPRTATRYPDLGQAGVRTYSPESTLLLGKQMTTEALTRLQTLDVSKNSVSRDMESRLRNSPQLVDELTSSAWEERLLRNRQASGIQNAVGIVTLNSFLYRFSIAEAPRVAAKSLTDYQAARLRLACAIYSRKFGRLPDTLEQLVSSHILPEIPVDPFSPTKAPFQYSATDRYIYSVWENQTSEFGTPDWRKKDRLYSVRRLSPKPQKTN